MPLILDGTLGVSGVDGSAGTPSLQGTDSNTGVFYATDIVGIATNGSERMRIDSNGNVGIGTISPSVKLQLQSGVFHITDGTQTLRQGVTTGFGFVGMQSNHALVLFTNDAERMRIDSSGNVGIGMTPSGDSRLEVYSADSATIYKNVNTGTGASDGFYVGMGKSSATEAYVYNRENNNIIFGTNNTERMRITSDGVVLINRTGQISTEYFGITFDGDARGGFYPYSSTTNTSYHITFGNPNGAVGSIYTTGSATGYATSSDYRLKENIAPMTGALAKLQQLKPVTYSWKTDGSAGQGFIAHELQAVVPDAVTGEKDAVDADGNPVYQGVDTSFLVATLTAAIQEQQAMIEELKQEVAKLKGV